MSFKNLKTEGERIKELLGNKLERWDILGNELTLWSTPQCILESLQLLRDHPSFLFNQLMDVCGVDYLGKVPRFQVVYHLLSTIHNKRVRLKVPVEDGEAVPSSTSVFKSALWWEREAFDLMGISFSEHPDLRRILTDYGFQGHPLRKDFPLSGYVEVRYDETQSKVVYEPVNLPQAFRDFDFSTPWEGSQSNLNSYYEDIQKNIDKGGSSS